MKYESKRTSGQTDTVKHVQVEGVMWKTIVKHESKHTAGKQNTVKHAQVGGSVWKTIVKPPALCAGPQTRAKPGTSIPTKPNP